MAHKCKFHGYEHEYTVCGVCAHQYCARVWESCPRCAELMSQRPVRMDAIRASLAQQVADLKAERDALLKDVEYYKWRLRLIIPLFQEARDALPAITLVSAQLRGINLSLGDRMDEAGTATRAVEHAMPQPLTIRPTDKVCRTCGGKHTGAFSECRSCQSIEDPR